MMYSLLSLELNQLYQNVAFLLRRSAASCGFARETNSHHMPPSQAVDMVTVEDEFAGIGAAVVSHEHRAIDLTQL